MNEHQLETLSTALDAYTRASVAAAQNLTLETANAAIRAQSVLLDTCISLGMPPIADETEWAAKRITSWLVSA